ncbi:hypothetical protein L7F22_046538 [Adiantum nelumboides]|nr:hypothetical protein [Adiantum nelumboides]
MLLYHARKQKKANKLVPVWQGPFMVQELLPQGAVRITTLEGTCMLLAHKQLEVSGIAGGLTQAAIHYFTITQQAGELTFENGNPPGSQSSNMLAELMLLSANDSPIYETKAGDVLGLAVKVKGLNDKNPREILYNTSVIRTDEVMEAIKGQSIDNFSLWPDLVSSWKWERSASKG